MRKLYLSIGALTLAMGLLNSCSENENAVGDELLGISKVKVSYTEDTNILFTNTKDVDSDLSNISTALVGTLNDEIFGKTNSGAAFQLRLTGAIKLKNPQIDSVKLYLAYKDYYGIDTLLKQKAKVYLLKDDIKYDKIYNAKTEINSLLGDLVGTKEFNKKLASDTIFLKSKLDETKDSLINNKKQVDTIIRHLTISLDNEKVGQYILNGSKTDFESVHNFINYFKGLYVKTEDVSGSKGAIYGFNVYRSYLQLYFKNQRDAEVPNDTMYTASFRLPITDNSARFNKPTFEQNDNLFSTSDYIYLQGIHGTKVKINMPDLNSWKDSTRLSVNKAELVFKIVKETKEKRKYELPLRLELIAIDKKGKKTFLRYSSNAGNIPNGLLNMKEETYTFHIPEYLQEIVDKKTHFDHFEISTGSIEQRISNSGPMSYPGDAKNSPARVVLYNLGKYKPQLNITYSKY